MSKLNTKKIFSIFCVMLVLFIGAIILSITTGWDVYTGTPQVKLAGLRQESVIYDGWESCPNGDGTHMTVYQLHPINLETWATISSKAGEKWVRGPVTDPRYEKAFCWAPTTSLEHGGPPPEVPYEEWLKSKHFYFYMEDYKEFEDKSIGDVHCSTMWILDSRTNQLYYVSGSM